MSQVPCHYRIKPCKIYQKVPLEQPGTWSYQSWSRSVLPILSELPFYIYTVKYGRHATQFCRWSHTEVHTYCSVTHSIASTYLLIYWCCVYAWVYVQCAWQGREENEYIWLEENSVMLLLSIDGVSPRDWTQDLRRLCTLSQLHGPQLYTSHSSISLSSQRQDKTPFTQKPYFMPSSNLWGHQNENHTYICIVGNTSKIK